MSVYRIYVEKKPAFAVEADSTRRDIKASLGISLTNLRLFNRYDVEGIDEETFQTASRTIFSEPQVDTISMELPELSGQFTVNQMEHGFRIATARCGYGKKLKLVGGLLGALSRYLAENRMVPCCIHCGSTEPVSLCQCGEGMAAFCEKCAGECAEALAHSAAERKAKASSIPKGILGAVIGALPGVILWLLIYRVGYLAAVCGLVMAYGAFKGYSLLGGRLDKKGVAVGTAVSLVMLVFAMMLCYAWALLDVFGPAGFGFLDCFLAVPTALAL